jgi:endonuclease/exonuclease/phosphatase family metal-dependent hydrolase
MTRGRKSTVRGVASFAAFTVLVACTTPARLPAAHVSTFEPVELQLAAAANSIKVVSLNAAHSRSMGIHQAFQSSDKARANLDAMAEVLLRENADIVALQEVDGPSVWSGGFDHVDYLARKAGYSTTVRGTHMKTPGLDYGTALMARYPLSKSQSVGFGGALSIVRKGFVISEIQWPGKLDTAIDLISLHLDPLRAGVRERQVERLISVIAERGRPVIVMGDFNDDWQDEDSAARLLADSLGLQTHGSICENCHTHRRMKNFVDWIIVSPELKIESFAILEDDISDHYAVSATLSLKDTNHDQGAAAF